MQDDTPECPFELKEWGVSTEGEKMKYIGRQECQGCMYDWFEKEDRSGGLLVSPWEWGAEEAEIKKISTAGG